MTPVVWIVLHSHKFVNPENQTLLNSAFGEVYLVFLQCLEEECWFLYDFGDIIKMELLLETLFVV